MHPNGDPTGTRTRISTLKGWCPRPVRRWGQINAGFYLTCRQLQVRPVQPVSEKFSLVERWTRPMRCDLIVKLLFVVAEPAQFYFSITLSLPRLAAQRFDPRFIAEISARLTVTVVIACFFRRREMDYSNIIHCIIQIWLVPLLVGQLRPDAPGAAPS